MEQRIQELEEELAQCRDNASSKDREVIRLEQELEQLRAILAEIEKHEEKQIIGAAHSLALLRTQQELDTVRGKCADLEEANTLLEDKLANERTQREELTQSSLELSVTMETLNRDNECYEKERVVLKNEVVKLHDEVAVARAQAATYEQDFQQERKDRENAHNLKEEIRMDCDKRVHAMEAQCEGLTKQNDELRQKVAKLQQSLDKKKRKDSKKKNGKKGEACLQEADPEMAALENLTQAQGEEIEHLQRQLMEAKKEMAEKQEEFEQILEMKTNEWERDAAVLRERTLSAEKAAVQSEENREAAMKDLNNVREELNSAKEKIQRLSKQKVDEWASEQLKSENEKKALEQLNHELKATLAQVQQKLSTSHEANEAEVLTLIQRVAPSKDLHTGAERGDSFKNSSDQRSHHQFEEASPSTHNGTSRQTTPHGSSQHLSSENPSHCFGPGPNQVSSSPKTFQPVSDRPQTFLPSASLPIHFEPTAHLRTDDPARELSSSLSSKPLQASESGTSHERFSQSYQSPDHKSNHSDVFLTSPQPHLTDTHPPTARLPSSTQSLPTRMHCYENVPDIEAHLYVNILDDDTDPQCDLAALPESESSRVTGNEAQPLYVNLPDSSTAEDEEQTVLHSHTLVSEEALSDSLETHEQSSTSTSNSEVHFESSATDSVYVNLPNLTDEGLYMNQPLDLNESIKNLSRTLESTELSSHDIISTGLRSISSEQAQKGYDHDSPVPAPRKLKPTT